MVERLELVGLIMLALIACTWAWLFAIEKADEHYGNEDDDGWEMADIDAAIIANMRKGLAHDQARLGNNDIRIAGNSSSGGMLADSDGIDDDRPEITRSASDCGCGE